MFGEVEGQSVFMSFIVDGSCTVIERSTHTQGALISKHTISCGFVAQLWSQM
jgi:hypothetical protein